MPCPWYVKSGKNRPRVRWFASITFGHVASPLSTPARLKMVKVLIFGLTLRDLLGENEFEIEPMGVTTVKKLIEAYPDQFGPLAPFMANREVLVAVNKKVGTEESLVKDGDVVKLTHQSRTSHDGVRDIPM